LAKNPIRKVEFKFNATKTKKKLVDPKWILTDPDSRKESDTKRFSKYFKISPKRKLASNL
jgi:hypothetical protein